MFFSFSTNLSTDRQVFGMISSLMMILRTLFLILTLTWLFGPETWLTILQMNIVLHTVLIWLKKKLEILSTQFGLENGVLALMFVLSGWMDLMIQEILMYINASWLNARKVIFQSHTTLILTEPLLSLVHLEWAERSWLVYHLTFQLMVCAQLTQITLVSTMFRSWQIAPYKYLTKQLKLSLCGPSALN